MRVLFAAKHPPVGGIARGGVASWISTISGQFIARGHGCAVWGPGVRIPKQRFDVGVLANYADTERARDICDGYIVVSHGIVSEENPHEVEIALSTSEEVRDFWRTSGEIVRQPIDLEFWRPERERKPRFVFYSYRARSCFGLDIVARQLGLEFVWLKDVDHEEAREVLQSASLVAASGRAALEAMACNAPTMICDDRDYNGGPLIVMDMNKARRFNYSGRGGVRPEAVDMRRFALETMFYQTPRRYAEKWHDAGKIADDLLNLC